MLRLSSREIAISAIPRTRFARGSDAIDSLSSRFAFRYPRGDAVHVARPTRSILDPQSAILARPTSVLRPPTSDYYATKIVAGSLHAPGPFAPMARTPTQ
jgi:hypothetical protein